MIYLTVLKTFMFKNFRKVLPILLLAVLLLLLYGHYKSYRNLQAEVATYKTLAAGKSNTMQFQDKTGRWHSETTPVVIESSKVLKELSKTDSSLILIQSQISGLKKDMRNMIFGSVMTSTINYTTETDLRDSLIIINDTLKVLVQKFDLVTPYLKERGEIVNGKLKRSLEIKDTIVVSAYWERKWFLGKKHFKYEAVSRNPDAKIFIKEALIMKK